MGGLGNQMFQFAAARSLAIKRGTTLQLDLSWFYQDFTAASTPRNYELNCFCLDDDIRSFQPGILERFGSVFAKKCEEQTFSFNPSFFQLPNNVLLIGYFQSEQYFLENRQLILNDFTWRTAPSERNKKLISAIHSRGNKSVSLHVRRGDYVSNSQHNAVHGTVSMDYYKKAVKAVKKKVQSPFFYIFSDDPEWCQKYFSIPQATVIAHNTSGSEDLRLMKECHHNILANSSFSWWGTWLGRQEEKLIFAPKNWFKDKSIVTKDLIPEHWNKI